MHIMTKARTISEDEKKAWRAATLGCTPVRRVERAVAPQRRITVEPKVWDPILDLHGMTLMAAHSAANNHVLHAYDIGWRRITIVTGLSGQIKNEFDAWLTDLAHYIQRWNLRSGGGAYEIWIRRNDKSEVGGR